MAITTINWIQIEQLTANEVYSKYTGIEADDKRKRFLEAIKVANDDMLHNYNNPCAGGAYALWHHLLRADNVYNALRKVHAVHPLPVNMEVLDIGSGTGSGAAGVAYWTAKSFDVAPIKHTVHCIEEASPMRFTASYLTNSFYQELATSVSPVTPSPFTWEQSECNTLKQMTGSSTDQKFDIILFSHTFFEMTEDEQAEAKVAVSELIKFLTPTGVLMFLTPRGESPKIEFINSRSEHLLAITNLKRLVTDATSGYRPNITSCAPAKNPAAIVEVRQKLNQECVRLGIDKIFGENPKYDYPYYGFYCQLDAFGW